MESEQSVKSEPVDHSCDPCLTESEYATAVSYCEECKVYLCQTCNQVHRRLAATKDHTVNECVSPSGDLPSRELKTSLPEKCLVHADQLVDRYCLSHGELCCVTCLSKAHHKCEVVRNIPEYLQSVDMAQILADLQSKFSKLTDDVSCTLNLVKTSLKAVELNYDVAKSKMFELKTSVLAHIEQIYDTLSEELNVMMTADKNSILQYKNKCDSINFEVSAIKSYLKGPVKHNREQLFLAVKKAEVKVDLGRIDLQEIKRKRDSSVTRYSFTPHSVLTTFKRDVNNFGKFTVQNNAIKTARHDKTLHVFKEDKKKCCITGIAVLSKDTLIVADNNNDSVKLVDIETDMILSKVNLESAPWAVTAMSDKQVAVTVPDKETVYILSVTENRTLQNLSDNRIIVKKRCYGIAYAKNRLFITTRDPTKVEVYSTDGKLMSSVDLDMANPENIVVYLAESKLYISDNKRSRRMKELNMNNLEETETLNSCRDGVIDMAVDNTGVLYYCDSFAHVVDAVCIDERLGFTKENSSLLSDLSRYPRSIAFENDSSRLLVGMNGNEVGVYYVV